MTIALRISSEAFPAIRPYKVNQVVVPLTDGLTKPPHCFQVTPPSILKNWLYNNLSLLVLSTLPVKTHEDQCWGGWEGPHSPSAPQKKGVSCQALPDRNHHRSSDFSNREPQEWACNCCLQRQEKLGRRCPQGNGLGIRACNTRGLLVAFKHAQKARSAFLWHQDLEKTDGILKKNFRDSSFVLLLLILQKSATSVIYFSILHSYKDR